MMKQFVIPISEEKRRLKDLKYTLYTDGSCNNAGNKNGGWAVYIIDPNENVWLISGSARETTSNRMEMTAIIEGLQWILEKYDLDIKKHVKITLFSDSTYCVNSIRDWMKDWRKNAFTGRPNSDLLLILDSLITECNLIPKWVPRNSNEYSTWCDATSNQRRIELN
jgi:ribonuclease HI